VPPNRALGDLAVTVAFQRGRCARHPARSRRSSPACWTASLAWRRWWRRPTAT
jgi:hypothetical protein